MKTAFLLPTTCLLVWLTGQRAWGEMRTWTDHTGKHTIQAEYLGGDKQEVTLGRENGQKLKVRLSQLSEPDRQFVRKQLASAKPLQAGSGEVAAAAKSGGDGMRSEKETTGPTKEEFAVYDIKLDMTLPEVSRVLQRKGIRPNDVECWDPRGDKGSREPRLHIRFPRELPLRFDNSNSTEVEMVFYEDLPSRPGTWVCTRVKYRKVFPRGGGAALAPMVWSKVRGDLITRFGPPTKEEEGGDIIIFGNEETRYLKAKSPCNIQLADEELAKRLEDAFNKIRREETQRSTAVQAKTLAEAAKYDY